MDLLVHPGEKIELPSQSNEVRKEIVTRLYQSQLQPIKFVLLPYLPSLFGINIMPAQSAMMIFHPISLAILAVANFCFVLILEWDRHGNLRKALRVLLVYALFAGGFALEFAALYVSTQSMIFHFGASEEKANEVHEAVNWAKIQVFITVFFSEIYFGSQSFIGKRILYSILSRVY
jgi:hypothetical protein